MTNNKKRFLKSKIFHPCHTVIIVEKYFVHSVHVHPQRHKPTDERSAGEYCNELHIKCKRTSFPSRGVRPADAPVKPARREERRSTGQHVVPPSPRDLVALDDHRLIAAGRNPERIQTNRNKSENQGSKRLNREFIFA